ncbi:MAG: acetylxylan esterase [Bacteroidales bacterium]|nr:acetylxylan esterase [Candidatus Liminaster caballi]
MKKLIYFALMLFALSACTKQETDGGFVTVRDGHFELNGKEYRYVGTNFWYGAILASEGRGGNRERLIRELDLMRSNGVDNVRVLIGGDGREGIPSHISPKLQLEPGVYNDTILLGLDYLMAELEKRDMKAVLYFNNAWEWSGGYGAYLDWVGFAGDVYSSDDKGEPDAEGRLVKHFDRTPVPSLEGWYEYMQYVGNFVLNDSAKALAANHVKNMVTRVNTVTGRPYTESKAIMSWEIANEPRCFVNDSLHKAKFVEWIDQQSSLIKSLDPNHLVTTGSEGRNGCEEDMDLFTAIHTLPNIDYACIHIWPNNWGWLGKFNQNYDSDKTIAEGAPDPIVDNVGIACEKTLAYIDEAYSYMQPAGRPVVLEEFGYPRDRFLFTPGSSTKGRDAYYRYVFDIIRQSGKIAGCNFWGWGGYANVKNVIWQPYDDYVCDPAQEEQGLNSVFACDTTTLAMIKEMNTRVTCTLETNEPTWVWEEGQTVKLKVNVCNSGTVPIKVDSVSVIVAHDTGKSVLTHTFNGLNMLNPGADIDVLDFAQVIANTELADGSKCLEPGFYHIYVKVNGKDIVNNVTEVYGTQMNIDHYVIGVAPEKVISAPDAQPDFAQFWDKARAELAATPMKPVVTELKDREGEKRAFVAQVRGLNGDLVQIDYTVPNREGKFPIHIINMGYSSKPWPLDLTDNGWINVIVSSRGQGRNNDTNRFGDWVRFGLSSPDTYYYRGAYLDCSRAIDFLSTLPQADTDNIFLEGGSQGGAYSMACAALDHRVTAVACYITFMSDFPDYFKIVSWPYSAIHEEQQRLGISDEDLYRTLSYFDIKNLASWIECPVYMAIGLQDVTCPPHTNFSGFNLVTTPKQYHIYRNYGHHVDYSHWTPTMMEWYEKWKK